MKFENTLNFPFQHVFNGVRDLQSSFERYYAPVIKQAANGDSTMLTFCGLPISDSLEYFTSINGRIGFISLAAQLLLRAAIVDGQNPGTVTMSWYKIDCGNGNTESIIDLLRSSSPLHGHKSSDPNLILRELGKGRGMIVPGLWEVELNTPQDVDAVINHVHRMFPTSHHDGLSHTVFQFTIAPHDTPSKVVHNKTGSKTSVTDDSPGVGRLSIVLLSNLSHIKNLSYTDPMLTSLTSTNSPSLSHTPHVDCFPWVHLTADILYWMESRRPSPPFHKSRLLLLLRDALCLRMPSVFTLFLSPTVADLPDNSSWLHLLSRLTSTTHERFHASAQATVKQNPLSANQSNILRESSLSASAAAATVLEKERSQATPKRDTSAGFNSLGDGPSRVGSEKKRNISPIARQRDQGVKSQRQSEGRDQNIDPQMNRQHRSPLLSGRGRDRGSELEDDAEEIDQFPSSSHLPQRQRQGQGQSTFTISSLRGSPPKEQECFYEQEQLHSPNPPPPPPSSIPSQASIATGRRRSVVVNPIPGPHASSQSANPSEPKIVYVSTLPEGAIDAEGAEALISSLEALRNEVHTLRQALAVSQQRLPPSPSRSLISCPP
jgi:hypothetical protein